MESICRPIFNDFVCGFDIIHLCLFDNSLSTKHNGVSKMCLFTPQSVAIGHSKWIEIEFTAIAEKRAICITERRQWHAHSTQPNRTTSLSLCLALLLFFYWMWNILCHIYSIVFTLKVSLYDIVCISYSSKCKRLCACLCVTKHENK